ncbi:hypothetical protein [Shewanella algae]|uniref:hypothetical protein n=1 Tax=Shewanella algae TaxID=38313 RepID=UPI003005735A
MMKRIKGAAAAPYTAQVTADWIAAIKGHPDRFDAALFRPVAPMVVDTQVDAPLFGEIDDQTQDIAYSDAVFVECVESNGEDDSFLAAWDGDESMGYGASGTMILRIAESDIPTGSILEFLVANADGTTSDQFWYIHHSEAVGTPAIGFLHYLIPCGDVEQLPDVQGVMNEETALESDQDE